MKNSGGLIWYVLLAFFAFAAPASAQESKNGGMSYAQATRGVWVEGSYEYLALPDVKFVINSFLNAANNSGTVTREFINDDGGFHGNRIDGGISNIPIMGSAYMAGVKGFFAWHDQTSTLDCAIGPGPGTNVCIANALVDIPNSINFVPNQFGTAERYTTDREVKHWGVAIEVALPMGLRAGPAFRQIDQGLTITGRTTSFGGVPDRFELTYSEDLVTNYWGGFIGAGRRVDLGGGWSLSADGEAGLYWADTGYDGSYVVTNATNASSNLSQQLSLQSDKLAFIGVLKASLEKDFGWFRLAGFGRFEYISSAPDVRYNDRDDTAAGVFVGPDDTTRLSHRSAHTFSVGVRLSVPLLSAQ